MSSATSIVTPEIITLKQHLPRSIKEGLIQLKEYEFGPVIPGLQQGAVPQGLAYSEKDELIFISSYFDKNQHPSAVSVIEQRPGKIIRTLMLKESETTFHYGHVGGLAVDDRFLWVASREKVYQYELETILYGLQTQTILPIHSFIPEARASFSTYSEGILWIGEFVYQGEPLYHSKKTHHTTDRTGKTQYAWVCGYDTATLSSESRRPQYTLSVPQKVQGIQFTEELVLLSISYGRRNKSKIAIYSNPLLKSPHTEIPWDDGKPVPLWYLDDNNKITEILLPPLAEGITMIHRQLAILFESGAKKFQHLGKGPIDSILLLDLNAYLSELVFSNRAFY